jgi:hypothetical protein
MKGDFESQLVEAARRKLLRELEREQAASVVNNIQSGVPVTLAEQMAAGKKGSGPLGTVTPGPDEDLHDYYVAIQRKKNDKGGWDKYVKRFKAEKDARPPRMEDIFGE